MNSARLKTARQLNTIETALTLADQRPPWREACGTRGLDESGSATNTVHSSTEGRSHWHRKKERTFHHTEHLDIRHTADHRARKASLQPACTWTNTDVKEDFGVTIYEFSFRHFFYSQPLSTTNNFMLNDLETFKKNSFTIDVLKLWNAPFRPFWTRRENKYSTIRHRWCHFDAPRPYLIQY